MSLLQIIFAAAGFAVVPLSGFLHICEETGTLKISIKKGGAFLPPPRVQNDCIHKSCDGVIYFLNLTIYFVRASPFLSMAYSTVLLAPVEDVLRSVS